MTDKSRSKLGAGIAALLIVATLFTFVGFVSVWFNRQVLQTSYWTDTSTELLESEAVRDALGTYVVDQLFNNVDVQGQLAQRLPPDLAILAGPAANGLRELALRATDKGLASPKFQSVWQNANVKSHTLFLKILDGEGEYVDIDQGVVTVDVKSIVTQVADQIGVGKKLVGKLPASAGSITVLQSEELKTAQNAKQVSDVTAVLFPILALLLYALAIGLAGGRRRRVVLWAGVSWVATGVLVFMAISLGRDPFVSALAATTAVEPAVIDVYSIVTQLLHSMATSVVVTGALVIAAALLAGPSKWAVWVRRHDAPYLRDYPVATAAFAALLYLLIIWWAPTIGFRTTGGLLINTTLVVAGFVAYRQMCVKEFPDEQAVDFGEWWREARADVEQWWAARRERPAKAPGAASGTTASESAKLDQLERLAGLRERGVLTDEEFASEKESLLSG